jgi:Asp-tRNA(Asn)/Glu-tRNA(Gln) amidotransferase C subunit
MSKKITGNQLKKFILNELSNLREEKMTGELQDVEKVAKDVEEVEASEYASALEQDIDFMKALKIQEAKLIKKLRKINEAKGKLRARILKNIDKE